MKRETVLVALTVQIDDGQNAVEVAQRWLPHQRELPLGCSDGAQLVSITVNTEQSPKSRYEKAWSEYIEEHVVVRADGDVLCPVCNRRYRFHLQPLKDLNPTIRILCDGSAVKL